MWIRSSHFCLRAYRFLAKFHKTSAQDVKHITLHSSFSPKPLRRKFLFLKTT